MGESFWEKDSLITHILLELSSEKFDQGKLGSYSFQFYDKIFELTMPKSRCNRSVINTGSSSGYFQLGWFCLLKLLKIWNNIINARNRLLVTQPFIIGGSKVSHFLDCMSHRRDYRLQRNSTGKSFSEARNICGTCCVPKLF